MERINLNKPNNVEVKEQHMLKTQYGLQLLKTEIIGIPMILRKVLDRISTFHPKRV
jgi:hypothetical protein